MTMTALEKLLIDVCTDTDELRRVQSDPEAALRAAGASDFVVDCMAHERGSWISMALNYTHPVPTQQEIDAYLDNRTREDAFFADRVRVEPRRILERSFGTRFPNATVFEVREVNGFPAVTVTVPAGLVAPTLTPYADSDIDTDIDVDVDVDTDVDVDVDIDVDVDAITVIDVDVDVDVDVDNVVDNVVDTVVDHSSLLPDSGSVEDRARQRITTMWTDYWTSHQATWSSRDSRSRADA